MKNTTEPASIKLKLHGVEYSVEGLAWDINSDELLDTFKRMLVAATFPPSILDDEDGEWHYVEREGMSDERAELINSVISV